MQRSVSRVLTGLGKDASCTLYENYRDIEAIITVMNINDQMREHVKNCVKIITSQKNIQLPLSFLGNFPKLTEVDDNIQILVDSPQVFERLPNLVRATFYISENKYDFNGGYLSPYFVRLIQYLAIRPDINVNFAFILEYQDGNKINLIFQDGKYFYDGNAPEVDTLIKEYLPSYQKEILMTIGLEAGFTKPKMMTSNLQQFLLQGDFGNIHHEVQQLAQLGYVTPALLNTLFSIYMLLNYPPGLTFVPNVLMTQYLGISGPFTYFQLNQHLHNFLSSRFPIYEYDDEFLKDLYKQAQSYVKQLRMNR